MENIPDQFKQWLAGLSTEERKAQLRAMRDDVAKAFTEHPESAGETYLEHLKFTACMGARFLFTSVVITIHGLFPFLLERTASSQIEAMYRIMKQRIPPTRRDEIDADYII